MRLALVTNFVPPYRRPVYEHLGRLVASFRVFTFAETEKNRAWSPREQGAFERESIPGLHFMFSKRDWALHVNAGVYRAVARYRPDVVIIGGYDNPGCWSALAAAHRVRARVVLWNGSHEYSALTQGGLVQWLKRIFVGRADAYVTYGSLAASYLQSLGAASERIVTSVNAIDTRLFQFDAAARNAVRTTLAAGSAPVVCFSGQLIRRKGLDVHIEAMRNVPGAVLLVVGDGELRASYESVARRLLDGRVTFLGSRPYRELPGIYGASDVFVMPSLREVWGLVVNEAMAVGVPVIATHSAGATPDLIAGKGTGFAVAPGDVADLSNALTSLVGNEKLRAEMGRRGRELIEQCSTERYARDMFRAAELALA